jgi:hypothetical protein
VATTSARRTSARRDAPINRDPDAPEYAGVRADLARLFISPKAELRRADGGR